MTLTDAGPLVALIDADEADHEVCRAALGQLELPPTTTWPAFTEAMYLLSRAGGAAGREALWRLVLTDRVCILGLSRAAVERSAELMATYADLPMDVADATLVRRLRGTRYPPGVHAGQRRPGLSAAGPAALRGRARITLIDRGASVGGNSIIKCGKGESPRRLSDGRTTMAETTGPVSPVGATHRDSMRRRARGAAYRKELEGLRILERVARLVIARRAQLGLTQEELAERMGTSHSAISRIESGRHRANVDTLQRLAAALETELEISFRHESEAREDQELLPA